MRGLKIGALLLSVVMLVGLWAAPAALAEEKPRRGGMLRVAIAGDPPSLDMHQEQTFLVTIPFSTVYNTLVVFDPHGYPNIIGDLAKSWTVSDDKMTWTFTLHQGVKFHDGSDLTSADVKASWDKIVFPPEGVVSPRKSLYQMIKSIEAPDPYTVVFRLHYPSPSFLSMLAHPANFIYAKKYLDQDPNYYKQNAMGSGPFKLKEYVQGASIEMERNPKYWKQGLPYMDGIKYYIIKDDGARAKAIRSDRADVEFRGFPPAEVEAITGQMGNKVTVAYPGQPAHWGIAFNVDKKPFDDERVRKAMSLALDRYDMAKTLAPLTSLDYRGGTDSSQCPVGLERGRTARVAGLWQRPRGQSQGSQTPAGGGGLSQRLQDGADQPLDQIAVHRHGGLSGVGVEEGRHRGRAPAGGERHLEQEPGEPGFRAPAGSHGHVGRGRSR